MEVIDNNIIMFYFNDLYLGETEYRIFNPLQVAFCKTINFEAKIVNYRY